MQYRLDTEPRLARITEEALRVALDGFPLQPKQGMGWLTRAVRGALYVSLSPPGDEHDRQGNSATRDDLFALAEKVSRAWLALSDRDDTTDAALFDYAWHGWQSRPTGDQPGDPPDWRRFQEAVEHMDWLGVFLRRAGMMLEAQRPNWRLSEQREERVFRAQCLSVVFVRAFALEPTVNTWETAKTRGPWPDFYQRVVRLAFGENVTPNLETVLDEARRRDLDHRVSFAAEIIPDEPL